MVRAQSTDRPVEPRLALGMGLRLVSALSLALMFAGVKWVGARGANIPETLFYRQVGSVVCAAAWAGFGAGLASLRTKRFAAHAVRMAIGVVAMGLNFLVMTLLPLAEATAIGFSVPIFATVLAAMILREQVGRWRWTAVVAGFVGVLVIIQPGSGHVSAYGALAAIGAAVSTACATIAIRHLGATEAVATTVFWFGLTSLVPLGLLMPVAAHTHDAATFAAIAGLGLAGGIAQLALTGALRFAPVSLVMPMDYSSLLWASLLGWLIFGQLPTAWTLLGAPIVILAGLFIVHREQRLRRRANALAAVAEEVL